MKYDFTAIEKKWQKVWADGKVFAAENGSDKEKFYALVEFPYPSGAGLHVGHPRPYTAMDTIALKKRMEGKNVLFPIGFDAFGLPTENFAIKNHVHPAIVTRQNIENFTRQLHMLGYSFDWDRVIDTTDPNYYKWTQWIFLQLYKHGLAYKATMPVNWCTRMWTTLSASRPSRETGSAAPPAQRWILRPPRAISSEFTPPVLTLCSVQPIWLLHLSTLT